MTSEAPAICDGGSFMEESDLMHPDWLALLVSVRIERLELQ